MKGESLGGQTFDGKADIALFPGDLPDDPESALATGERTSGREADSALRFVRFRPPPLERTAEGQLLSLPHIRLDRALEYLLGDRLA
jgi:predicted YcjX-like family ATPase